MSQSHWVSLSNFRLIVAEEVRWLHLYYTNTVQLGLSCMDSRTSINTQGPVIVNSALLYYGMLGNDA